MAHHDAEKVPQSLKAGVDNVNSGRLYCSPKWLLGFIFTCLNPICQSLVLPFVDMTLLCCNSAIAIIINVLLSTKVLGEEFTWKYDFTAMVLIATGVTLIVLRVHTEQVRFSGEEIREILFSVRTGSLLLVCLFFFVIDRLALTKMLVRLRKFEKDGEAFDHDQQAHF